MKFRSFTTSALLAAILATPIATTFADVAVAPAAVAAVDDAHHAKAADSIKKGIAFLKSKQDADGSWSPKFGPAITAIVINSILSHDPNAAKDPAIAKGIAYVMSKVKPDGGIHSGMLENYNTAISLSMLARINDQPEAAVAIKKAQDYLRGIQCAGQKDSTGAVIDEKHPFYGGTGYGGGPGRPDMTDTEFMIQSLHDSGLDCKDPAYQRALVFISRCQASDTNTAPWRDKLSNDGGFVYSTSSTSKDKGALPGIPETKAGEESIDVPGKGEKKVLRSYGTMTYAGFKSYLYAQLDRKDPRVQAAWAWITKNYTLEQNPGFVNDPATPDKDHRQQGYYYYFMTFSRALNAWGEPQITAADGSKHIWANELIDKVTSLQKPDGSWINANDRWAEGDANLVTAYSLIALENAAK